MERTWLRQICGILTVSAFLGIGAPVWAHHSMAAYDHKNTITLQGVITSVKWTNPHMLVYIDVKAPDGQTNNWIFEGGAVTAAINAGMSPKVLKPGALVKITGRGHLDETKHMALLNEVEIDGKVYGRNGGQ